MINNFDKKTDEELVKLAKEKDLVVFEYILSKYKGMVTKLSRSYYLVGGDIDDLIQEGMIGLVKAITNYNFDAPFKSFAYICIKSSILSAIKGANRYKNMPLKDYVSLSNDGEFDIDKNEYAIADELSPEETYINKEAETELKDKIYQSLSPLENSILAYYLQGYTYADIGKKIDKNSKTIDNAIQRIRKKIKGIIK